MTYQNQWPTNRLLSTAARLVEHAWNDSLASFGLTHAGVMALDVLRTEGAMTQAQLAQKVRVQAQTMGKTLHRLEVHGHITRSKNAHDRRSHVVAIAPAGESALSEAARLEKDLVAEGAPEEEQLRRSLVKIITSLGGKRWKLEVDDSGTITLDEPVTAPESQD